MIKKSFIILLIINILSFSSTLFATSITECNILFDKLVGQGYTPIKQNLQGADSSLFPYNIVLYNTIETQKNKTISLTIEDALKFTDNIGILSLYGTIVFTANDYSVLPANIADKIPAGTDTWIQSQNSIETTILFEFTEDSLLNYWKLIPGCKKSITPEFLFKSVSTSLEKSNQNYYIPGGLISLYRLGFMEKDVILETYLSNNIPTILLKIPEETLAKNLSNVLENISLPDKIEEVSVVDTHYSVIMLGSNVIFISETFLAVVLILITGFALFLLCGISFLFGKGKDENRKNFIKYWYISPLLIPIVILLLWIAQCLVSVFFPVWQDLPLFGFILKILFTTLLLALCGVLHRILHIPSNTFVYGFLMTITAFANIYIFAAIDLPLLIVFGIVYFIVYLSRPVKKTIPLILYAILAVVPFSPFAITFLFTKNPESLIRFIDSSLVGNFLFAVFAMPFIYTALRILSHTLWKRKKPTFHKVQVIGVLIVLIITIILMTISALFSDIYISKYKKEPTQIIQSENKVKVSVNASETLDFVKASATIESLLPVLKYDISIISSSPIPIYSSNYPFTYFDITNGVSFNLPENPPNSITITYIADMGNKNDFIIKAYMKGDNSIIVEDLIIPVVLVNE